MIIGIIFSFLCGFAGGIWAMLSLFDKKDITSIIQVGGNKAVQTQSVNINNNTDKDNDDYMEFLNRIHRCHDCTYSHWYINHSIFGTALYCTRTGYPIDTIKCTECSDKELRKDLQNLTDEETIAYEKMLNEDSKSTGITL